MSDPPRVVPEKIYTCLLRLFPPAFRRKYQEEALRLLTDRLREERGTLRRLRLSFDLLADIPGALRQAYRNSYPPAAPVASAPHFDGGPAFQVLQKEPMRRAALILGGFAALTAVAGFIYVMQGPIALHPAQRKGHPAPIAMVMEHLNQPVSDSLPSDAARLGATAATTPLGAVPDQNSKPGVTPRAVSMLSSQASVPAGQQTIIRVPAAGAAGSNTAISAAAAPNIAAGWTGSWRAANGRADLPRWFSLTLLSARLAVVVAPDSSARYVLLHAQASGDSISFELQDRGRILLYDLEAENNELRGTATITSANGTNTVAVRFDRAPSSRACY